LASAAPKSSWQQQSQSVRGA